MAKPAGGKWGFILDKFKGGADKQADNPSYVEALQKTRDSYRGLSMEVLSESLSQWNSKKKEIEDTLKAANLQIAAIERVILERMEEQGLASVEAAGYRLTVSAEPYFAKRDGAKLREWAQQTNQEDLLTINSQTLTSLAKTHFLEHGEPPPGVELTNAYKTLSRTKKA